MRLLYITRSQAVCVRCKQPQGAEHLPACPFKRLTASTDMAERRAGKAAMQREG